MLPGFVVLGAWAVLFQVLVVGGTYAAIRYSRPVSERRTRRRAAVVVGAGTVLVGLGQLVGLLAVGSLRVSPLLLLQQAIALSNRGAGAALFGYLIVSAGIVLHLRASD